MCRDKWTKDRAVLGMNAVWYVQLKGQSPARDLNSQNCPLQGPSSLAQRSGRIVPSYDFCLRMRGGTLLLCMHKVSGTLVCKVPPPASVRAEIWMKDKAGLHIYITLKHRGEQQHLKTLQSNVVQRPDAAAAALDNRVLPSVWYVQALMLLTLRVLPWVW
jgi:hypothetical protein